ncbi:ankyrin-3-like [Bacillus rossius redtenbacheri]|uniref:ankyrin-3-like n=1 Tax=Bacillus rossius redtenbacheri TaxID=93214 RepID=UPI002FDD54F4
MESLEEKLYDAVVKGNTQNVSCLLAEGADINAVCSCGRTALGTAAQMGNVSILKTLLSSNSVTKSLSDESICGGATGHHRHRSKKRKDFPQGPGRTQACAAREVCRAGDLDSPGSTCKVLGASSSPPGADASPKRNLGYFVVIYNDGGANGAVSPCSDPNRNRVVESGAPAFNDVRTPDGMERLEWDEELREPRGAAAEEDPWTSHYRWYADILDKTGSLLQLPQLCDVNQADGYGRCALHYAAEQGHLEALRLLWAAGCRLDQGDTDNLTALHLAASRDHHGVVTLLLSAGVDVNCKTSDKTSALHIAATRGFAGTARVLLDRGASIDSLDSSDRTPLMLAVLRCHHDVVALLIQDGAKVNIEEIHGYTPLCEAVWHKDMATCRMLLDAGAKVTQSHHLLHYAVLHRHYDMARLLLRAGCIANLRDDSGNTPLILAASVLHCPLVELLLQHGASVNYPNALTGSTALHKAVEYAFESNFSAFESLFALLKSRGAGLNVRTCTGGDTPLFRAVLMKRYRAAALLIRHGTDVNLYDAGVCVVDILFLARKRRHAALARMLVYAGFDLQRFTPDLPPPRDAPPDGLTAWLLHMKHSPLRLVDLCRLVLRRAAGEHVYERVRALHLPASLKTFLLLEDMDVDDDVCLAPG